MDVREGFKQTEVGDIPEDWNCFQLDEITAENSPICYGIVQVGKHVRGGVPVLAIKNLNTDYATDVHRAAPAIELPYARSRIQPNDVMISVKGTTGRIGIVPEGLVGNISRDIARFRVKANSSPRYCYQMLRSDSIQRLLAKAAVGTTRMELSINILKQIRISLPPTKAEQEAIAEALSDADGLIESLEQLIAKKRQIKQGAMQELLTGKRRLPGFDGEWKSKKISSIARVQRGASPRPIDSPIWFDENSSVGWVRISDVTRSDMYLWTTSQRLSELGVQHSRPVEQGSLIMSICATVGRPIITKIDVCIHDGFVVLDNLDADILYLYYCLAFIEKDWGKHGQTGSQMNLNTNLINNTKIQMPSDPNEQTAISTILSDMDAEITELETKLTKARKVKQGMMQELLTGRIRLV